MVAPERTACQAANTARSSSGRAIACWASAWVPSVSLAKSSVRWAAAAHGASPSTAAATSAASAKRPWASSVSASATLAWALVGWASTTARSSASASVTAPASLSATASRKRTLGLVSATRPWIVSTTSGAGTPRRSSAAA